METSFCGWNDLLMPFCRDMCGKQWGTSFEGPSDVGGWWLTSWRRLSGVVTHIPERQLEIGFKTAIPKWSKVLAGIKLHCYSCIICTPPKKLICLPKGKQCMENTCKLGWFADRGLRILSSFSPYLNNTQNPHHFWNEWTLCLLGSHKTEGHIITIVAKHLLISYCLIPSTF